VLGVEDWAEIRRLRRPEAMSISQIARVVGLARNTVKAALSSDGPPKYRREPAGSLVDGVEPRVRELLKAYPSMPATAIAERVGWPRWHGGVPSALEVLRCNGTAPATLWQPCARTSA